MIVSSGLPQLILPVLEREGVELEVRSNFAEPAPDGWRVQLPPRRAVPGLRRPLQAALAAGRAAARLRRRRLVGPLRVARRRPRVRAHRARAATSTSRASRTSATTRSTMSLLRFPDPYDFELSTGRFRAFGTDLANRLDGGCCTARSAAARCASRRGPGGVDVEPLDDVTRPVVEQLLGAPFELDAVLRAGPRRRRRCSRRSCERLARLPPAAAARSVRGADHVDHGAAGVALRRGRDPQPAGRALRRRGSATRGRSRRASGSPPPHEDELVEVGFTRRKAEYAVGLARSELDLDGLAGWTTTRCARASPRCAGSAPGRRSGSSHATSRARARGRPATSRCARRPTISTVSR